MKALTVRQPWAECIARGAKLVENRTRGLSYRGQLAIHAAQAEADEGWTSPLVNEALRDTAARGIDLVHGAVIAVAELVDVHESDGVCCGPWAQHAYDGPRSVLYHRHLVLEDVRPLTLPVPARGALGLWNIEDDLIRRAHPIRTPAVRPGLL